MKIFSLRKIIFCCAVFMIMPQAAFAAYKIQPDIVDDAKQIAYGAGLVKFCPLLLPVDYVSFTQDQLMAERLINFEHKGDYKFIFSDQEIAAKQLTQAGLKCGSDILSKIIKIQLLIKQFISTSPIKDEVIVAHPQQPKLNQAFIFAGFMQARLAWFYQRKCKILLGDELDEFNQLVLSTQAEIELVFRPEQAQQLNARMSEPQYSAIIKNCNLALPYIEHAIEMMSEDIPNSIEILKRF